MEGYWIYLIYFGAGVLQDVMIAIYYRFVSDKKAGLSAFSSVVVTIINLTILYGILTNLSPESGLLLITAYALGNGVGTFIAVKSSNAIANLKWFRG